MCISSCMHNSEDIPTATVGLRGVKEHEVANTDSVRRNDTWEIKDDIGHIE